MASITQYRATREVEQALTPEEVAAALHVSTKTLANWRYLGGRGPAFVKDGGVVRYPLAKFHAYLNGEVAHV